MALGVSSDSALVLFSGGQDSTVCLGWALERFARVETVGFDYGQRHAIELDVRPRIRDLIAALKPEWKTRLGEDHVIKLDALAAISDSALTRETAIEIADNGLPTTFVPGPQSDLLRLRRRARLSPRRPAHRRRHVRDRLFRLSRLPRRHRQGDAGGAEPRPRQTHRHPHAADVGRQGRTPSPWPRTSPGSHFSTSLSRTPIAATWATARTGMTGVSAAAIARPANCGRKAMRHSWAGGRKAEMTDIDKKREHSKA